MIRIATLEDVLKIDISDTNSNKSNVITLNNPKVGADFEMIRQVKLHDVSVERSANVG